jgi:NRAMP (natural resistance-associated macrophage protein)-like metal ion transporter
MTTEHHDVEAEALEIGGAARTLAKPARGSECEPLSDRGEGSNNGSTESKGVLSWSTWSKALGPGLLVCLADTDAGCIIVAAQSGARWGYSLLILQILLIPVLFVAQELTIRLGVYTRKGHTACIRDYFGKGWAWFACTLLVIECVGAMISEMSGIAAIAQLWGFSLPAATISTTVLIVGIVTSCNYRQIEKIGITLGLFELTFIVTMVMLAPSFTDVLKGSVKFSYDPEFIKLISANMGAVIMPWMIYFHQSAIVSRRMRESEIEEERASTLAGSILTQGVMIGALVSMAAAHAATKSLVPENLKGAKDIVFALSPVLGDTTSKVMVSLAFVGGSLCAAFVVALAGAWAVCEAFSIEQVGNSLDGGAAQAPAFYGCFFAVVGIGAGVLMMGINVVQLSVAVELLDGILMPFAVGFLYLLATSDTLPAEIRVVGKYKAFVGTVFTLCSAASISSVVYALVMEEFHPRRHYRYS